MSLSFRMLIFAIVTLLLMLIIHILCFFKEAMLRRFYAFQSLLFSVKEVVLCYYYDYMFISCSDDVMVFSIFYAFVRKNCHGTEDECYAFMFFINLE